MTAAIALALGFALAGQGRPEGWAVGASAPEFDDSSGHGSWRVMNRLRGFLLNGWTPAIAT